MSQDLALDTGANFPQVRVSVRLQVGSELVRAEIVRCVPKGPTFCLGTILLAGGGGIKKHVPAIQPRQSLWGLTGYRKMLATCMDRSVTGVTYGL